MSSGPRGARRSRLSAAYNRLTEDEKEELRFAKEEYKLQRMLEYIGAADCPVTLSQDSSVPLKLRCAGSARPAQGQLWGSFGRALGELWESFGRALGELWGSFGRALGELWGSSG
jgi:hypothetical protein